MGFPVLIFRRFAGPPFGEYGIVDRMLTGAALKHVEEKFDAGQRHLGGGLVYGIQRRMIEFSGIDTVKTDNGYIVRYLKAHGENCLHGSQGQYVGESKDGRYLGIAGVELFHGVKTGQISGIKGGIRVVRHKGRIERNAVFL